MIVMNVITTVPIIGELFKSLNHQHMGPVKRKPVTNDTKVTKDMNIRYITLEKRHFDEWFRLLVCVLPDNLPHPSKCVGISTDYLVHELPAKSIKSIIITVIFSQANAIWRNRDEAGKKQC